MLCFLFQALNEICETVKSEVYPEEEEETGGGSLLRYHVFVSVFRCAQDKQNCEMLLQTHITNITQ